MKPSALACMLLAFAPWLASCDLIGPQKPTEGGTLTMALAADPPSLNRFVASDPVSLRASAPLFPNLFQAQPDMSFAPDLAESMPSISADGRVWTVRLRRDARWSDGKSITATDVVTTVKIQQALAAHDPLQAIFDWAKLDRVEAVDDHTVRFSLTEAYAPFLANSLATFVAPAHVYGAIDIAKMSTDPIGRAPTVTGGPYRLEKRDPGREIDLVANPDYYGGKPHIARIVEKVLTDPSAAVNSLAAGEIQWEPDLPADAVGKLRDKPDTSVYSYPDFGYFDVRFNDRADHLFGDKSVRQAFAYAVDKEAIVRDVTGGTGTALWGDILPSSWAYDAGAAVRYPVDRGRARALMQQAGWSIGADGVATKNGKRFSAPLYVRSDATSRQMAADAISKQVKEIGMELVVTPVDFLALVNSLKTGAFDVSLTGWTTEPDPDPFRFFHSSQLKPEHDPNGRNWTGYANPQLDQLIETERATLKPTDDATRAARKPLLSKIEHLLSEDVVTYFMWIDNTNQGFSSNVAEVAQGIGGSLIQLDYGRDVRAYGRWYLKKLK